jgi:hypothetical protein
VRDGSRRLSLRIIRKDAGIERNTKESEELDGMKEYINREENCFCILNFCYNKYNKKNNWV